MKFRLRIDDANNVSATIAAWAETVGNAYVIVHHLVNDNSHFHLYLDAQIMSAQALRYRIKSRFSLEPVQYSVGLCDEERIDEYLSYLFNTKHGNIATLHKVKNIPDERLKRVRDAAHVVSEEFAKQRKSKKVKTLYEIAQEVRASVKDDTNAEQIIFMSVKLLHKYCKCHDRFLVIKLYETVRSMVNPSEYTEYILRIIS